MRELPHVLGIVLAGGEGKRLYPLTADRAKPAVPFGGAYRLIDFVLSNLVNARYLRICVLTQYKSHSLDRHISQNWRLSGLAGEYITPVPAQQRLGPRWYTGSADAIYQSLNLIYDEDPDYIVVFGADHVYRMDPEQMVKFHIESGAGATVAGIRVPRAEASAFGCIDADESGRIKNFVEKPADPPGTPDDPEQTFVSMGNYIFTTKVLIDAIKADAEDDHSDHDMGGDIIPRLVSDGIAAVYDFNNNEVPGATERDHGYWRGRSDRSPMVMLSISGLRRSKPMVRSTAASPLVNLPIRCHTPPPGAVVQLAAAGVRSSSRPCVSATRARKATPGPPCLGTA